MAVNNAHKHILSQVLLAEKMSHRWPQGLHIVKNIFFFFKLRSRLHSLFTFKGLVCRKELWYSNSEGDLCMYVTQMSNVDYEHTWDMKEKGLSYRWAVGDLRLHDGWTVLERRNNLTDRKGFY